MLATNIQAASWTPIRLGITDDSQIFTSRDVIGLDFGFLLAGSSISKRTIGIQVAPGSASIRETIGISLSAMNVSDSVIGIQAGGLNEGHVRGIQIGAVNAGDKFGNSSEYLKPEIGLKIGFFNLNVYDESSAWGVQAGFINVENKMHGFQIGLVNFARELHGIQIGLVNHNDRNNLTLPIINAHF